ncbi:PEP-CTERM sorting domain-containing protein [Bythopirellula polymerisocia]|uniref:Ice-binding protein C-terminal domain-containing protein n=1 Tax=Bythopirellula polymerisocia TaxID=2528003 RepID=A0A5C6CYL3_9BACT|nr:PEP-CTERM sorting domain-containing protein [Bythopirellula polymerisocia]TWU28684.1 hypothetical protein Pla144_19760 [Bythopirellula polymerisocia]
MKKIFQTLSCVGIVLAANTLQAGDAYLDGFAADGTTPAPTVYHPLLIADFEGGLKQGWSDQRTTTQSIGGVLTNVNAPLDEVDGYVWARLATSPLPGVPDSFMVGDLPGQYDMIQFDIRYDVLPPSATSGGLFRGRQFMWEPPGVHSFSFHNNQAAGTPTHPADNNWHTHVIQRDFNDGAWDVEYERVRIDPVDYNSGEPVSSVLGAVFSIDNIILGRSNPTEAFPAISVSVPNIIKNGDLSSVSNKVDGPNTNAHDINGGHGNFGPFRGSSVDVDHWAPYNDDPNDSPTTDALIAGVADGGELDLLNLAGTNQGSYYLDTHWSESAEWFSLNSAQGYLNGMIQTDILNGVTIDAGKTYELAFDLDFGNRPNSAPNTTFTVALTTGADPTDLGSTAAIFTSTMDLLTSGDRHSVSISGADLLAAQNGSNPVNLVLQSVNTTAIPGFPGSVVADDHANNTIVFQVQPDSFFLGQVYTPQPGDVNKDGLVTQADVTLAQLYHDGNGGETAMKRQDDLAALPSAPFAADILASLNLADFDLVAPFDYFDQADVDAIAALVVPTPGDFDGDGDVDGRDFLVWQRGGTTPPLSSTLLGQWQANYGVGLSAVTTAVPEPTSLVLVGLVLSATTVCGRRRV